MSCFHPLKGYIVGVNPVTGKDKIWIRPYDEEHDLPSVDIPCGRCIGCRLEYSRQWANRLLCELQYHDSAYFVTLTYDNDYLPREPVYDRFTGEYLYDSYTLRKKHLQTFMKHLRRHFESDKIRFFACGEYGSQTVRPHYHLILFGLHLDDLVLYKRSPLGDDLYNSPSLQACWSNYIGKDSCGRERYDPLGHVVIGKVTWESCAYVARYVTKKMSGELGEWFVSQNMELPFCNMSRKPGLGRAYYDSHPDMMHFEFINIPTENGAKKFRPPKYFEKLYEIDEPELASERSEKRKCFAEHTKELILKNTDLSYLDYLAVKEENLKGRLKALDRSKA